MKLASTLARVALWSSTAAFVASGLAGWTEDVLGWSDDLRWIAYGLGWALAAAGLVGAVAAKVVATSRGTRSSFPTLPLVLALVVGVLVLAVQVVTHLGPMGVV